MCERIANATPMVAAQERTTSRAAAAIAPSTFPAACRCAGWWSPEQQRADLAQLLPAARKG